MSGSFEPGEISPGPSRSPTRFCCLIPGMVVAAVNRLRPRLVSLRAGSWLFATLAIWAALLRLPLYGACSLLLAAGLGRPISDAVASPWLVPAGGAIHPGGAPRSAGCSGGSLVGPAGDPGKPRGGRIAATTPGCPQRRVDRLGHGPRLQPEPYGYPRNTTPNLARWARKGVRYDLALAPAPWTYPSHSCFFTGQWPFKLNSQWKFTLDTPDPTLAEYLALRGAIRPPGSRRTPTAAITRPGWLAASPISRISR